MLRYGLEESSEKAVDVNNTHNSAALFFGRSQRGINIIILIILTLPLRVNEELFIG